MKESKEPPKQSWLKRNIFTRNALRSILDVSMNPSGAHLRMSESQAENAANQDAELIGIFPIFNNALNIYESLGVTESEDQALFAKRFETALIGEIANRLAAQLTTSDRQKLRGYTIPFQTDALLTQQGDYNKQADYERELDATAKVIARRLSYYLTERGMVQAIINELIRAEGNKKPSFTESERILSKDNMMVTFFKESIQPERLYDTLHQLQEAVKAQQVFPPSGQ